MLNQFIIVGVVHHIDTINKKGFTVKSEHASEPEVFDTFTISIGNHPEIIDTLDIKNKVGIKGRLVMTDEIHTVTLLAEQVTILNS